MELLLGNKERFGIQVKVESYDSSGFYLGFARLWLGGKALGTFEDFIFLKSYLTDELLDILKATEFDDSRFSTVEEKFFYLLGDGSSSECEKFRFGFGTMSDAFNIRIYKKKDKIVFLWRHWRHENEVLHSDLKGYGNQIHEYKIPYDEYRDHVIILDQILSLPNLAKQKF